MRKYLFLFSNLFFALVINAQQWSWASSQGTTGYDFSSSVAVDSSGNTYIAGMSGNSSTVFLTKYSFSGAVLWTKKPIGGGWASGVAVDASGYIYVTGAFMGSLIFGTDTLHSQAYTEVFIAKYDSGGNVMWAKSSNGNNSTQGCGATAVTTDRYGNIYICGYFYNLTLMFDAIAVNNLYMGTNPGQTPNRCLFLAKYDSAGAAQWVRTAGGNYYSAGTAYGNSVGTDKTGNVYVAGGFACTSITFGAYTLTKKDPANSGGDMFIAKFNNNGNALWAKSAGSCAGVWATAVAVDASGNAFVAGMFDSPALIFGTDTLINPRGSLTSNGAMYNADFLVKYNSNGQEKWAKSLGSNESDDAYGLATDNWGTVYMTGGRMDTATLTYNLFIVRYDTYGNMLFTGYGNGTSNYGMSIAADISGNVYVTGNFYDSLKLSPYTLYSAGGSDAFVAKLYMGTSVVLGITEQGPADLNIFPNPSSGVLTIKSGENISSVAIFNLLGEKTFSSNNTFAQLQIDLSVHPKGIYFVELHSGNERVVRKIIIQ